MSMESLWTPLFSFMVFALVFGLFGDAIAYKTKAVVSAVIVGCLCYLAGFLTGVIPTNSIDSTGLTTVMNSFGIAMMITNLGTMINLKELIREWKTVLVACAGLVGIAVIAFTVGTWLFGREYALCSAPPISGGIIATILTSNAANEAGRPDLAAFATLVCSLQMFVGLPVASKCLKMEAARLLKLDAAAVRRQEEKKGGKELNLRVIKHMADWMQTSGIIMFKLAFVAVFASWVSALTKLPGASQPILNSSIAYLIFGVLFTEIGFLDRDSLQKANAFGIFMLGTLAILPGNFGSVTIESLIDMIIPLVGMLVFCSIGIAVLSVIAGKVLGYSAPISIAVGITALFGYPCTQIVTEEVVKTIDATPDQREMLHVALLPKMLIGGFTTVSVASVIFAGIIVPMIF